MTKKEKIIEITKALFDTVPIAPVDEKFPFVVSHPFTNSNIVFDGNEFIDLFTKEGYSKWRQTMFAEFDRLPIDVIFGIVNKPYRLCWIKYVHQYLTEKEFAEFFADAWVDSENPNCDVNVPISELIKWYRKANKQYLMEEEDYKVYSSVPEEFIVYRGVSAGRVKDGLSWTRSKKKAEWFRDRFLKASKKEGLLLKAKVKKKDLLAYFNTRDEDEYVIDVSNIKYEVI